MESFCLYTTMKAPTTVRLTVADFSFETALRLYDLLESLKSEMKHMWERFKKHWTPLKSWCIFAFRLFMGCNKHRGPRYIFLRPHESCHDNLCTLHPFPRSILVCDYITQKMEHFFSHGMQDDTASSRLSYGTKGFFSFLETRRVLIIRTMDARNLTEGAY